MICILISWKYVVDIIPHVLVAGGSMLDEENDSDEEWN